MPYFASTPIAPQPSPPQRSLSQRRGSVSAPDPYGKNAVTNNNRSSTSTLTIVRVVSPTPSSTVQPTNIALQDPPTSPARRIRRLGNHPTCPQPPTSGTVDSPNRVSFAFSSFGSSPSGGHGPPGPSTSPSSSPRLRPSSPHRLTNSSMIKPRLSPDQLVQLARQSMNVRHIQQQQQQPASPSSHSPHSAYSPSSGHRDLPPSSPSLTSTQTLAPATFTPLPQDIFLPFIDRPSEVLTLITSPPSHKLFALLAQTFHQSGDPSESDPDPSTIPDDPLQWTYPQLFAWLTRVDRMDAPDPIWALKARKCILQHSELIWERIKGALGIPPELDYDVENFDEEELMDSEVGDSAIDSDDISSDEGRKAKGHWDDWDAVMDSPIFDRRLGLHGQPVVAEDQADSQTKTGNEVDDHLLAVPRGDTADSLSIDDDTVSPTPIGEGALSPSLPSITHHLASPTLPSEEDYGQQFYPLSSPLSIEALLTPGSSPSTNFSVNPPPLSLGQPAGLGDGLGDIAEGAEDESEAGEADTQINAPNTPIPGGVESPEDPDLVFPSQIQGLRISTTSPLPASNNTPPVLSPVSPLPPYQGALPSRPESRTPSFGSVSSMGSFMGFRRSESFGSAMSGSLPVFDRGDEGAYDPVGDRGPGNPLFPSNFARLAVGPTLSANNPRIRSPVHPPLSRYTGQHLGSDASASLPTRPLHASWSGSAAGADDDVGEQQQQQRPKARTYSHGPTLGRGSWKLGRRSSAGGGAGGGTIEKAAIGKTDDHAT